MIGDLRIALTLAASGARLELIWRQFPDDQPVRPHGFFGVRFPWLSDGRNRAFFCLEADRSTMPRERFLAKLHTYQAWHAAGAHTAALGIKSVRVLTVTKSVERLTSLVTAAAGDRQLGGRHAAYWFTRTNKDGPLDVFGPIWRTAADPEIPCALIVDGPPAPST